MSKRRTFTKAQKLAILKECAEHGVTQTLEKHGIYPATYYDWKRKLEQVGEEGLNNGHTKKRLKRIAELEQENDLLKRLLAEKQLESSLKDELLKKKYPKVGKRYS